MNKYFYILLFIITTSCGISEDCFKGNGSTITLAYPYDNFTKIKVYSGVGLVIKEGPVYEVKIETRDNIKDNIEVTLNGDMLIVKDNSTCNIVRDYGVTTVYITIPDGSINPLIQELELHCKTEKNIDSIGTINSPTVRIFSIGEDGDGSGSGDFNLNLNTLNTYVESNTVSNFHIFGVSENLHVFFSWGNGIFNGESFEVNNISFFHRGSNDIVLYPINTLSGDIYSTGNVVLRNSPIVTPNVTQHFTGRLIYN